MSGRAILAYQEAIRFDPEFALAYSKQSSAEIAQVSASGMPREAQLAKSRPLIDQAILLDPQYTRRLSENRSRSEGKPF